MRFLFLSLFASLIITTSPSTAQEGALENSLEQRYQAWRQAMVDQDSKAWTENTAAHRRATTRNLIVSQKKRFPKALFELPLTPPSLKGLQFLAANKKGRTAASVYYGKVDFDTGEANVPEGLLVLRFTQEGGAWKYDTLSLVNLKESPEVRVQIQKKDLSFLEDPMFQANGKVPPTPAPCAEPDYITDVHIISLGYESTVAINRVSQHRVSDDVATELVMGGLKDGANSITIQAKPIASPASEQRLLRVSVHVKTGDRAKPAIKVYEFTPTNKDQTVSIKGDVFANRGNLGKYAK